MWFFHISISTHLGHMAGSNVESSPRPESVISWGPGIHWELQMTVPGRESGLRLGGKSQGSHLGFFCLFF